MSLPVPGWKIKLPTFMDVAALILHSEFLDDGSRMGLTQVNPTLSKHSNLLNTWVSKPWQPIRKRRWGFGKVHKDRSCSHDRVNPRSMLHFCWNFLDAHDRLRCVQAFPQWKQYAHLRTLACVTPLSRLLSLKVPRKKPIPTTLDMDRARLNSASLLRFDFNYGDFARWMGGEFTNRGRDWTAEYDKIENEDKC